MAASVPPFLLPPNLAKTRSELGLSAGCAVEVALGQPRRRGCGAVRRLRPGSGVDCWVDELAFAGVTRPPDCPGDAWMVTSVRETHEMILNGRAESGAEEWVCPDCGRRVLMRWPPDFERLILEHGDDGAVHVGAKGGVRMTGLEVNPSPSPGLSSEARQWLSNNGIDWDGTPA